MLELLKKIIAKGSGFIIGSLGLTAVFSQVGTFVVVVVIVFFVLYAIKIFKK